MILKTLELNNFQRWDHLEFNLNSGGLVLLLGKVGAGKSSIWDALTWCLFGVTLKGQKGDDVVSTFAGKDCSVKLVIEETYGEIVVERYRKHGEHKNNLYFKQMPDGVDLGGWDTDSTQEHINSLLGMDAKLFSHSVVFAQGISKTFVTLDDTEQKNLIEAFIDSTVYAEALKVVKKDISEFSQKIMQYNREIELTESRIAELNDDMQVYMEDCKDFECKRQQSIDQEKASFKECLIKEKQANKEQERDRNQIDELRSRLDKLQSEKAEDVCEYCGSSLPFVYQEETDDLLEELQDLRKAIAVRARTLDYNQREQQEIGERIVELSESTNSYDKMIERARQKKVEAEILLVETRSLLAEYQDKAEVAEFFADGFGPKGIKASLFDAIIPSLNKHLEYYCNKISEGVISVKLLPNKTLKSGDVRDKFSIRVYNSEGGNSYKDSSNGERRIINLSFMFAIQQLARERLRSAINLSILDEACDALEPENIEAVFGVLQDQAKEMTVFVVSHNDELKSSALFNTVYWIEKRSGRSKLNGLLL